VRLTGREGNAITLAVTGYQFPDAPDPARRFSWHVVAGQATRANETWGLRYSALTCDESPHVSRWLAAVAEWVEGVDDDAPADAAPAPLTLTEPNLTLRASAVPERGWVTLMVDLQQEFQAPSERRRGGTSTLTLAITPAELLRAVREWDHEIAPYPDGLA
jgi:hypothetical protein